jgi:hypothetical protein
MKGPTMKYTTSAEKKAYRIGMADRAAGRGPSPTRYAAHAYWSGYNSI